MPPLPGSRGPGGPGDPPGRGSRTLTRLRGGTRLLGVRVSAIVVLELVAASLLLFRDVPAAAGTAIVVVAVALAVAALLPFRGMRLGTWLLGALSYATRRRVVGTTSGGRDPGRAPDPRPVPTGTRGGPPTGPDVEPVPVPPEIAALFPGASAREITSRTGAAVGLVQWQGRWHALLAVGTADADLLSTGTPARVPVDRLIRALSGHGFELDALQVVTQTLHGNPDRYDGGALAAVAAEHRDAGGFERGRDTWIAVRIDPVTSAGPITVRGGGVVGLGRLANAAISRIEAEAELVGLAVRPLDARAALRAMTDSLLQPAGEPDAPTRWIESWKSISAPRTYHRCFAVKSWRERTIESLALTSGYGVTVAHEIRRAGDGVSVLSVLRLSATSRSQLDAASDQLRSGCRSLGVGLRLLRGQQAGAFRMTVPAGRR